MIFFGTTLILFSQTANAEDYPLWPPLDFTAGKDEVFEFDFGQEEEQQSNPDVAVLIGIENYTDLPDNPKGIKNLNLWINYFKITKEIPEKQLFIVKESQATSDNIEKTLKKAIKKAGKEGRIHLVYVGHGGAIKESPVLFPVDTKQSKKGMKKQSIDVKELLATLTKGKQTDTHIYLDTCWNGKTSDGSRLFSEDVAEMSEFSVDSFLLETGFVYLSQSTGNCFESLPQLEYSPFSYLGVGALLGWGDENGDEVVTGREVSEYINTIISSAVPSRSQGSQMITNDDTIMLGNFTGKSISAGPDREELNLFLNPKEKEDRGPNTLPWEMVDGIADFDDLIGTLREKRELAQTFESEKNEKESAIMEKATKHWSQVSNFAEENDDDFSKMAAYAYLQKYKNITVEVQDQLVAVEVPQVQKAENLILGMEVPEVTGNADFAYVEPGTFEMGSPITELDRSPEERQHTVSITRPFYISRTEVTQSLYEEVMQSNPSKNVGTDLPVEHVSWYDAVTFANRLSLKEGLRPCYNIAQSAPDTGRRSKRQDQQPTIRVTWPEGFDCEGYRLPTEAEWEYAARGNSPSVYSGSENVSLVAWYEGNSKGKIQPVAQLQANAFGLYDMSGNVWEWVWDGYGGYPTGEAIDNPTGEKNSKYRIRRGGSVGHLARYSRAAFRVRVDPAFLSYDLGFRLVRTATMPESMPDAIPIQPENARSSSSSNTDQNK